jgi:type III restriction enzyme
LPPSLEAHLPQVREALRKVAGRLDIKNANDRKPVEVRKEVLASEEFRQLWDRIKHKTTYRVVFDATKLIKDCAKAIAEAPPLSKARIRVRKADLAIGQGGVAATETSVSARPSRSRRVTSNSRTC